MLWKEKFYGSDEEYQPPIFKTRKINLPRNHPTPQPLKDFLAVVRSEFKDPLNRNKSEPKHRIRGKGAT